MTVSYEEEFLSANVGNHHVVGRWGEIFQLLAGENIDSNHVDLGVTVLSSLGGGHFHDLTWSVLDDNEAVLSESRTLHRIGLGGTCIGRVEGVLVLHSLVLVHGLVGCHEIMRIAPSCTPQPNDSSIVM